MGLCRPIPEKRESSGFICLSASRGPVVIYAALFASVALADFAESVSDCNGMILNGSLKASSILASVGVIEGIVNGLASPFIGAFADLTPYRKPALLASIVGFTLLVFVQAFLFMPMEGPKEDPAKVDKRDELLRNNETDKANAIDTNLPVPKFQSDLVLLILVATIVLQVFLYEVSALLTVAYSSELSADIRKTTHYIAKAYLLLNVMQLVTVIFVIGAQIALGLGSLGAGFVGGLIAGILGLFWFFPGAFYIGERKEVSSELNKGCCGLSHMGGLIKDIWRNYSELFKFLISWMLASASLSSITTLATSYLKFHLGFGAETTYLLGLALIFSVPGSWLAKPLERLMGLKKAFIVSCIVYAFSFIAAPLLLNAEEVPNTDASGKSYTTYGFCNVITSETGATKQETKGYILYLTAAFTALWGTGIGVIYPLANALYGQFVPGGRETSFFGVKVTFSKVLTWLPSLVFATINENKDLNLQYAILVLAPFFFASAFVMYLVDEEKAMDQISSTLHLRRGAGFNKTGKVDPEDAVELAGVVASPFDEGVKPL